MGLYLADRVVVYEGAPAQSCKALEPQNLVTGINRFSENLEVTFRRDPCNIRLRIKKMDSVKDDERKASGQYFHVDKEEKDERKGRSKKKWFQVPSFSLFKHYVEVRLADDKR